MLNLNITVFFQHLFQYQATAKPVFIPAPPMDGWFRSFSEPVKTVSKAAVLIASSGFYGPVGLIPSETVTVDKWYAPWSTPVRQKPGLASGLQDQFEISSSPVVPFNWYQELATPPKVKVSLGVVNQQFIAFVQAAPFTEATFESKWHYAWSEPVRLKPGLGAAHQQQPAWSTFTPAGETVTVDKWYAAWREPVRQKLGLQAGAQHFFSANFSPIVSFGWYQELATPPKVKVSLGTAHQQYIAFVKATPFGETALESEWHQPWSEPVRRLPPLRVAPDTAMVPFTLPYAIVSYGWNVPQTQLPPRGKPGLDARYQQAFTTSPLPITQVISITGILAAVESRDIMEFLGTYYSTPLQAIVGIIEKSRSTDPDEISSIQER